MILLFDKQKLLWKKYCLYLNVFELHVMQYTACCGQIARKNNVAQASSTLPENGVPLGITQGVVEMNTLQYFEPNLSGPATNQTPCSVDTEEGTTDKPEDHLDEADLQ